MEKIDIIKSIIQYLNEKGFREVGAKLEEESKISFESKQLKILKILIKNNEFDKSVDLILNNCDEKDKIFIIPKLRILQIFETIITNFDQDRDKNVINQNESLLLIRKICGSENLYEKDNTIEKCAKLIFIHNKKELKEKMKDLCYCASSKDRFFEFLESILSNSKSLLKTMHPKNLENMIDCVTKHQIKNCLYHVEDDNYDDHLQTDKNISKIKQSENTFSYFQDHKCTKEKLPIRCILSIEKHDEEITGLVISPNNNFFAAILKSNFITIYELLKKKNNKNKSQDELYIKHISNIKAHENQITSLVWNRKETNIMTASKDKCVKIFDILTSECILKINFTSMVSSAIFIENEQKILTANLGLEQKLNLWDIKGNLVESFNTVTVDQILYSKKLNVIILVAPTNKSILIYDYAIRSEIDMLNVNDTIISTSISKLDDGEYLLVNSSTSTPVLSLWHLPKRTLERKYFGHRQERLTTKCGFGGVNERFLISGSDGKEIYIWNRNYTIPISVIRVHNGIVNSVIWPSCRNLNIIISGSDDHTIKILGDGKYSKAIYVGSEYIEDIQSQNKEDNSLFMKKNLNGEHNNLNLTGAINNNNNTIRSSHSNEDLSNDMFEEYSDENSIY